MSVRERLFWKGVVLFYGLVMTAIHSAHAAPGVEIEVPAVIHQGTAVEAQVRMTGLRNNTSQGLRWLIRYFPPELETGAESRFQRPQIRFSKVITVEPR